MKKEKRKTFFEENTYFYFGEICFWGTIWHFRRRSTILTNIFCLNSYRLVSNGPKALMLSNFFGFGVRHSSLQPVAILLFIAIFDSCFDGGARDEEKSIETLRFATILEFFFLYFDFTNSSIHCQSVFRSSDHTWWIESKTSQSFFDFIE